MKDKVVTYMRSNAFFTCDCGKEVVASTINNVLYTGKCECGLVWEVKNGKIRSKDD